MTMQAFYTTLTHVDAQAPNRWQQLLAITRAEALTLADEAIDWFFWQ